MIGRRVAAAGAFLLLLAAYANHFSNGFHFDDDHTIVGNPFVRSLRYVPRYFVDATTFSVLPLNQTYRPVAQTTFAIDYRIGSGYRPVVFQIDTFVWYVLLLAAVVVLCRRLVDTDGQALAAAALFGLHPAAAETVNYIVQRGEILAALGLVAALALYAGSPPARRSGAYLAPAVVGLFAKQTAAVFPLLLGCYVWLYEDRSRTRDVLVSLVVVAAAAVWVFSRTPATAAYASANPAAYLMTQPYVAGRYFVSFFAPIWLSVDNDWALASSPADPMVAIGLAFVAALLWLSWRVRHVAGGRPIAFGLAWFLIAQLPTALVPLTETANDRRMFLPFIGLALAAVSMARLWIRRVPVGRAAIGIALLAAAAGVHARNAVWRTDESLWRDATRKSPDNPRAWMNYGVAQMARGDYAGAVEACERALPLAPDYALLHVNLGVAYGGVGRGVDAEHEFRTALRLAPDDWRPHLYYGRWLAGERRGADAGRELARARALNPVAFMNQ